MGSKSSSFQFWSPIYYVVQTHFQIATKKNGSQNKDFFYLEPIITAKRPPATAKTVTLSTKLGSKSHFFQKWSPFYPKTACKSASATFRNLPRLAAAIPRLAAAIEPPFRDQPRPSSHLSTTSRDLPATIPRPAPAIPFDIPPSTYDTRRRINYISIRFIIIFSKYRH